MTAKIPQKTHLDQILFKIREKPELFNELRKRPKEAFKKMGLNWEEFSNGEKCAVIAFEAAAKGLSVKELQSRINATVPLYVGGTVLDAAYTGGALSTDTTTTTDVTGTSTLVTIASPEGTVDPTFSSVTVAPDTTSSSVIYTPETLGPPS